MPLHTVTKHGTTKAGKPTVFFDNQHEFKDAIYLGNTAQPPLGAVIDTEMASTTGRNGTQMWFLNKWGMAPANAQPATYVLPTQVATAPQTPFAVMGPARAPIGASPAMPAPSGYTDGERLFMSNIVAAAITAGAIKDPVDLIAWTCGALSALRNAKSFKPGEAEIDNGPIPF